MTCMGGPSQNRIVFQLKLGARCSVFFIVIVFGHAPISDSIIIRLPVFLYSLSFKATSDCSVLAARSCEFPCLYFA